MFEVSRVATFKLLRRYRLAAALADFVKAISSTLSALLKLVGCCTAAAEPVSAAVVGFGCSAFGVVFADSVRFCAGRRYLSGEGFACPSSVVSVKSGTAEERLIKEPFCEPMTLSSLADGCDELSEEVVDDADADCVWACLCTAAWAVGGAEEFRVSFRRFGVELKAYGCTGALDAPRYEVFWPLYMLPWVLWEEFASRGIC